jgi:hypothetical protein
MRPCGRPSGVLALAEDGAVALGLRQGPDLGVHHPVAHRIATSPAPPPSPSIRFMTRVPARAMREVSPDMKRRGETGPKCLSRLSEINGLAGNSFHASAQRPSSRRPLRLKGGEERTPHPASATPPGSRSLSSGLPKARPGGEPPPRMGSKVRSAPAKTKPPAETGGSLRNQTRCRLPTCRRPPRRRRNRPANHSPGTFRRSARHSA